MAASSSPIVLFDLPSRAPCKAWSLNPWKTRFLFNFKDLDYQTEWVEYPDLKPTLEGKCAPHPESAQLPQFTSPTVRFPDGTYLSDSRKIADEVEKRHPTPSVHLDDPKLKELEGIMPRLMAALAGVFLPLIPERLLNEKSHPYWYLTREKRLGMPLSKLAEERGGDAGFREAQPFLMAVTKMLAETNDGPFFNGKEVAYVDFVWGGFLIFVSRIGDDVYEGVTEISGQPKVHEKLLEALKPWSARDDH